MSATELQLHDIDKLNAIVNKKIKKFVADAATNNSSLSPEVAEVLNSKVPVYHKRYTWLPVIYTVFCVCKLLSEIVYNPLNVLGSVVFMFFWYDFFSGLLHIVLDNPEFISYPVLGTPCLEFQWHHHIPLDLSSKDFLQTCGDLNTVTTILGGIYFGLLRLSSVGTCLASCKVLYAYYGQLCHCMAHTPVHRRSALVNTLQDWGFMVSPLEHGVHHKTYDDNFCIGSGVCNPAVTWCIKNLPTNKHFWLVAFLVCAVFDVAIFEHAFHAIFSTHQ